MELPALRLLLLPLLLSGLTVSQDDILLDGPVEALLGKDVTIKTLLSKPAFTFIIWNYSDGKDQTHIATLGALGLKTNTPYNDRVSISTDGHLTLKGLQAKDSGAYSISVVTAAGDTQTAETDLRVIEPVSSIIITSDVPEAIELNSTVVLTCTAKGSFLTFSWLNGTTAVVPDDKRITVKKTPTSSALSVSSVYRTDLAGPLVCSVSNSLSSQKSAAFNLTVYYGPEAVTISPASPPAFVASKSSFNLTCAARSSPAATFAWFRGDVELEKVLPVLTLEDIEALDLAETSSTFSCRASNAKTKRVVPSAGVSFAVLEPISDVKLSGPLPSAMLFAGNSSANLSCGGANDAAAEVVWLKDGAALTAGGHVVIAADKRSVLIAPLQKDDNGEYKCTMSNAISSVSAKVKLAVIYGPEPVQLSGESEVEVKDPVTLSCSASSVPPANYTWKFNGTKTPVTTGNYVIQSPAYSNTGTYTCEAYNALTGKTSSKTHFLSVRGEGELDDGLSDGAIAGIVIGVLAAVAIAIGLFVYCRQKVP
ncbi:cell adhesion molecule CEACAM20-like isoform X2 [Eucyclogobius newberryi]